MATNTTNSFTNHTGNNTAGPFSISFGYLAQSEVEVYVAGVKKDQTTHYTFPSATTISFTSGNHPAQDAVIKFQRNTNVGSKKVDFQDGSVLTEADLDKNGNQMLYSLQEFLDDGPITTNDLLDEDNMSSNSAVKAATQQSIKAYVDANTGTTNLSYTAGTRELASSTGTNVNLPEATTSNAGLQSSSDKTKLDGIEANSTADMTGGEIKTAYEAEADTNAFTDTLKTKLDGIATGAEVNVQSDWNSSSGDSQILNKPTIPTNTDTTYSISCVDGDNTDEEKIRLTAGGDGSGTDDVVLEAGTGLSIARSGDKITFTNTVTDTNTQLTTEEVQDIIGSMVDGGTETNISVTYDDTNGKLNFVSTDTNTTYSVVTSSSDGLAPQLPGSHGGKFLKADGTWEVPPDTNTTYSVGDGGLTQNNFTNTLKTKLDGIEASADVTDATNVNSAGAVMNSDLDGKGELLVGDGSGDPAALAVGTDGYILKADSNEATGVKWAAAGAGGDTNQNAFSNFAVSGQDTVAADSTTDTVTLVGGTNVTITTNASSDEITFTSTDTNTTYSVVTSSANGLAPQLPGSHGGKFLKADGTWEVPPDTNTQVSIDDTPVNGVTDEAISSNWAYDHNAATGNGAHVPAAGSSGQFLKHDGTWGTPPDTNTQLTEEQVEDFVGGMVTGNTETGITVTYQDADGTLDFAVADQTPEGTAILSTGETGGTKFLREDGDGTCSWQTVSGGGGSGDIEGVTAGTGLTGGGTSGTVTVNADVGIADDKLVQIDDADAADDDYAKFTANGIEGRSYAEVKTDLSLNNVENTAVSTWTGSANITTLGTVSTVTSTAVATPGVRKIHASSSAPGNGDGAVGDIWVKY